jgi:spermidine synthase
MPIITTMHLSRLHTSFAKSQAKAKNNQSIVKTYVKMSSGSNETPSALILDNSNLSTLRTFTRLLPNEPQVTIVEHDTKVVKTMTRTLNHMHRVYEHQPTIVTGCMNKFIALKPLAFDIVYLDYMSIFYTNQHALTELIYKNKAKQFVLAATFSSRIGKKPIIRHKIKRPVNQRKDIYECLNNAIDDVGRKLVSFKIKSYTCAKGGASMLYMIAVIGQE